MTNEPSTLARPGLRDSTLPSACVALSLLLATPVPGFATSPGRGLTLTIDRQSTGQPLAVPLLFQLPAGVGDAEVTYSRNELATTVTVVVPAGAPVAWEIAPLPVWRAADATLGTSTGGARWMRRIAAAPHPRWLWAVDLMGAAAGREPQRGGIRLFSTDGAGRLIAAAAFEVQPQAGSVQASFDPPPALLPDQAYDLELDLPHPSVWYADGDAPWAAPRLTIATDTPCELRWTVTASGVEWTGDTAAYPPSSFPVALALSLPATRPSPDPWLTAIETASGRYLPAAGLLARSRHPAWHFEQAEPWLLLRLQPAFGALLLTPCERMQLVRPAAPAGPLTALLAVPGRIVVPLPDELHEVPLDCPVLQSSSVAFNSTLQSFYRQTAFAWQVPGPPLDPAASARLHAWDGSAFHRQLRDLARAMPSGTPEMALDAVFAVCETALWNRDTAWFEPVLPSLAGTIESLCPAADRARHASLILAWLRARRRLAEAAEMLGRGSAASALEADSAYSALLAYLRGERWDREQGLIIPGAGETPSFLPTLQAAAEGWLDPGQRAWILTQLEQWPDLRLGGLWPLHREPGGAAAAGARPVASAQALAWEIEARLANGQYQRAWDLFTEALKRSEQADQLIGCGPLQEGWTIAGFLPGTLECWDPALRSGQLAALYVTGFFGLRAEPSGLRIVPNFPPNLQLNMVSRIWYAGRPLAVTRHANLVMVRCIGCDRNTGGLLSSSGFLLDAAELDQWHKDTPQYDVPVPAAWQKMPPTVSSPSAAPLSLMP